MPVAARVIQYFQRSGIAWQQVLHDRVGNLESALQTAGLCRSQVVVGELLVDARGALLSLVPFGCQTDVKSLNQSMRRQFQPVNSRQLSIIFKDCEPGSLPPIGGAYGVPSVCDARLAACETLYMQSGCHTTLIKLEREGLQRLIGLVKLVDGCSETLPETTGGPGPFTGGVAGEPMASEGRGLRERLHSVYRLPPMPAVATQILQITRDQRSNVEALAGAIEQDPSLAAQMIREARSPLYGFRGTIQTVRDAVVRVLGYDRVSQLAIAIAASKAFDVPRDGRLGLDQFWRHSLHCAVLAQKLAQQLGKPELSPASVYLAALLHNFGLLLLGHLFRPEYLLLSRKAEQSPETELGELERTVLGMGGASELIGLGHGELGAALLEHWQLPAEAVTTARYHTCLDYQGEHEDVVVLVQLANCLLKDMGMGDDLCPDDPLYYSRRLGLDSALVFEIFEQLKASYSTSERMASAV
ncbi:MAG: HDOD domain-containing protein [Hahellaceae bacterium]|nr:HDOD domain-containing protein [Hahellaceae bacterium]